MKTGFIKRVLASVLCFSMLVGSSVDVLAEKDDSLIKCRKYASAVEEVATAGKQLSAISMLNYMTVLSQEINLSSNSKLYLDNAYSSIVNNINPNAVDEDSLSQIKELLNTIYAYQSIEVKRDRLQYIYEQNQAKAIQKAIPNPMSVLNVIQADNPAKALVSVVYMAVDVKSSYDSYVSEVEDKYMQDGWVLDDEAAANLHESRTEAFVYMVKMCTKYNLDGKHALNENAVSDFVKWENDPNNDRRIEYLENNKNTFKGYGRYWLVLAKSYYDDKQYKKCLNAINEYNKMDISIFRKDHDLAKALTIGIAAAGEVKKGDAYIDTVNDYLESMQKNIENEDWALRYVAATSYMDLYARTDNRKYLKKAYDLTKENVNYLMDEQYEKNTTYISDIKEKKANKDDSDTKKKEIKNYNNWLKEERRVELPPVYEPLVENCELLFLLAKKINLSKAEKQKLDKILHSADKPLFLTVQLENEFRFDTKGKVKYPDISFNGKKLDIPANLLSQGSKIKVKVISGKNTKLYDDWQLSKVNRGKESKVEKFIANYGSNPIKKQKYSNGDKVTVHIVPPENSPYSEVKYTFSVEVTKRFKVFSDPKFVLESQK